MGIIATEVKAEFDAKYIDSKQGQSDLHQITRYDSETSELFTRVGTRNTVIRKASAEFTRVLQAFQKKFTPTGDVTFTPQEIQLFNMKVDVSYYPDDIKESWLGFLAGLEEKERESWPISRWMITQLMGQAKEDYELNEVFGGVFAAPADGVAGAAGAAMNGIKHVINAHVTDGNIAPIALGAVPAAAADVVAYVEDLVAGIPTNYRRKGPLTIAMSEENYDLYLEGRDEVYNLNHNRAEDLSKVQRYSNITVKGLPSHNGSNKMWVSPKENCIEGYRFRNEADLAVSAQERELRVFGDLWRGVGFIIPQLVWTNDVELA